MNELLTLAVQAHGGLRRWNQLVSLSAEASITGVLWQAKSTGDLLTHVSIERVCTSNVS